MEEAASWCRTGSERSPSGANVPEDFVRQLIDLGALPGEEAGLGIAEVRRSRLLHSWAAAGLSVETILALVDRGAALVVRFVGSCVVRVAAGTRRGVAEVEPVGPSQPWRYVPLILYGWATKLQTHFASARS